MVREVNQVPADYGDEDKRATTYKDRPLATETYVTEEQMATRMEDAARALSITSRDLQLWHKVLDVRLMVGELEVLPNSNV